MSRIIAASPGQPFNINGNNVVSSVSGSWVTFGNAAPGRAVRVQGIYWGSTSVGATLQIRDVRPQNNSGVVWYKAEVVNSDSSTLDLLSNGLTLFSPFQYYSDGSEDDVIIIYGEYL